MRFQGAESGATRPTQAARLGNRMGLSDCAPPISSSRPVAERSIFPKLPMRPCRFASAQYRPPEPEWSFFAAGVALPLYDPRQTLRPDHLSTVRPAIGYQLLNAVFAAEFCTSRRARLLGVMTALPSLSASSLSAGGSGDVPWAAASGHQIRSKAFADIKFLLTRFDGLITTAPLRCSQPFIRFLRPHVNRAPKLK